MRSARWTANSPTTVLPAPVGAQTSTPLPRSSASHASPLEVVEVEAELGANSVERREARGPGGPPARCGVPLGGARHARQATCVSATRRADALADRWPARIARYRARRAGARGTAESTRAGHRDGRARPVDAVLFDFHGTLAQVEDPVAWVLAAAAACGVDAGPGPAPPRSPTGWSPPGAPAGRCPHRVPPHLAEVVGRPRPVRRTRTGPRTSAWRRPCDSDIDGLADALYERLLRAGGLARRTRTPSPTLRALRAAGVPVAVVSNIGFDIRPLFAAWGLADLVDAFALSYEVGRCKPDPTIFLRRLRACSASTRRGR